MAALGFLSGFQGGMQSTLGLLDALDVRQRREQEAKQQQVIFDNKLEEYNYDKSVLRPLRENEVRYRLQDLEGSVDFNKKYRPLQLEDTRLSLDDKRALIAHNKQYRPLQLNEANLRLDILRNDKKWAEDDRGYTLEVLRPQEKRVNELNYDIAKTNFDTTKADNARKLEEQNLTRANQLYTAASGLVDSNPKEAERLMGEADKLSGGLFTNAANGVNSKMYQQAQEVMAGQRELDDPDFLATSRQFTQPTLITTGRNGEYELSHFQPLPNNKIAYALQPTEIGAITDRMIEVESGGRANAKNPLSSATGLGQFTESTWLAMVKNHRPDLAKGKSTADILALRNDPAISRAMTQQYAVDNSSFLKENNVPINGSTIYLAHHFGPAGAVNLWSAENDQPAVNVLGQKVMAANPHLRGKTVGEVKGFIRDKMTVPATKNRSKNPNDPIVADSLEQVQEKIQRGVELEQGMNPRLKEMLLARQLATGSKPGAGIAGKDRYMAVDGRVFDVVSQQFVTDKAAAEKDRKQWQKLDDTTLYNEYTGESKTIGAKGQSALSSFTKSFGDDPETAKASLVDQQFPELGTEAKATVLSQLSEAQTPDEVFSALKPIRIEQDASAWASDLTQGIDPELVKDNPQAGAISQLSERAKALGLAEGDIKSMALEVLQLPGVANNPQAQIQLMAEKLKIAELERKAEERYQRKQQAAADLTKESMPVGSPLSVFGE